VKRTLSIYYQTEIIYRMTSLHAKERKVREKMDKNFEFMLKEKVERMKKSSFAKTNNKNQFIDVILDEKNGFTKDEIRDNAKAIIFAVSYKLLRLALECRSIEFMRKLKKFYTKMFFLDVIEVLEVYVSVCVSVCNHDYYTFSICFRGRNDTKIFVISM
jgi:hypothetical protein